MIKKAQTLKKIKVYDKKSINFCSRAIKYPAEGCAFGGVTMRKFYRKTLFNILL